MAAKPAKDYAEDMELLRTSAVAAGIIAAGYFRREIKTWTKSNASPVTEADFLVDQFLAKTLINARPDYGWLSEESADDLIRLDKKRIFIVDPIDGTRAFINGIDYWTISLAIVEDGVAIAGVVYAPARDEMYQASLGGGAMFNGQPLVKPKSASTPPIIPASDAVQKILKASGLEFATRKNFPSLAYRLVQAATGELDVAVSRRGAQDWDIAGAAIILSECGVTLEDVCVGPPVFNKKDIRHGALAALSDDSLKIPVHDALRHVYGCPDANPDGPIDEINLEQTT